MTVHIMHVYLYMYTDWFIEEWFYKQQSCRLWSYLQDDKMQNFKIQNEFV